jgi:hypothetical protein
MGCALAFSEKSGIPNPLVESQAHPMPTSFETGRKHQQKMARSPSLPAREDSARTTSEGVPRESFPREPREPRQDLTRPARDSMRRPRTARGPRRPARETNAGGHPTRRTGARTGEEAGERTGTIVQASRHGRARTWARGDQAMTARETGEHKPQLTPAGCLQKIDGVRATSRHGDIPPGSQRY